MYSIKSVMFENSNNHEVFKLLEALKFPQGAQRKILSEFVGERMVDLLSHLPTNILERQQYQYIKQCPMGKMSTLVLEVLRHEQYSKMYRIVCTDQKTLIDIVFFNPNVRFLTNIATVGCEIAVSGKVDISYKKDTVGYQMVHPDHIGIPKSASQWVGIEAIYPLTSGITQRTVRNAIKNSIELLSSLPEWINPDIKNEKCWPSWHESIKQIHTPSSLFDLSPSHPARQRLAYDELFAHQINLNLSRTINTLNVSPLLKGTEVLQKKLISALHFQLTQAQQKALNEIKKNISSTSQMVRLLQGDVGCGKTLVATIAILQAIESHHQAAFLVPTEILAKQHFSNLTKLLLPLGIRLDILTGKETPKKKKEISEKIASGNIDLIIGTHAIIQNHLKFSKLGLVIVDEQHRFGVEQRLALSLKGNHPHILSMTATPIPRTLMIAGYGDMDVSLIKEKPANRHPITTKVTSLEKLPEVIKAVERAIKKNNKVYWVCHLVEDSEKLNLTAVKDRFNYLQQFFQNQISLVHGKMKSSEKEIAMQSFISGQSKILLATTVIEVGVDVPDATIIIIEHAEHFGLSQLHQLRGRVGRSDKQSACLLLYGKPLTEMACKRLETIRKSNDGFQLAEADLRIRGGGEIFGTKQSGAPTFRFADFNNNDDKQHEELVDLLNIANNEAREICRNDPHLTSPRGEAIKVLLKIFNMENSLLYKQSG